MNKQDLDDKHLDLDGAEVADDIMMHINEINKMANQDVVQSNARSVEEQDIPTYDDAIASSGQVGIEMSRAPPEKDPACGISGMPVDALDLNVDADLKIEVLPRVLNELELSIDGTPGNMETTTMTTTTTTTTQVVNETGGTYRSRKATEMTKGC